ncbi:MAG: MFS transporter [Acidimicrobiales bacterium]
MCQAGPAGNGDAGEAPAAGVRRFLYPAALRPGIVLWLGLMGLAGFAAFVPLYVDELGMDKADSVFAVYALLILGLRIVAGRLPDRLGAVRAASGALAVSAAGLLVMAAFASRSGLFAGTVVFALGMTFLYPALFPLVLARVPDNERSHAIGTFSVFFDLSQGFGAPTLGLVVALAGERAAFAVAAAMSIVALFVLRGSSFAAGPATPRTPREHPGPCEEPPPPG